VVAGLFPSGESAEAIAGLATLVRLTETDDIHTPSATTPSSVSCPVALAVAHYGGCSAEQLESAIWVATEIIVRFGMAIGGAGVLYRGLWPTRTGATLGAAAAACRVLGLSPMQTRHALSLAVILTSGRTGRFQGEPSGRWIIFASSVAAGINAARAAARGFTGDPAVVDQGWLERSLGVPVDLAPLTHGLGETSIFPQLSMKPFCTSRQALPGAMAMRELVEEGLDPATIRRFRIAVPSAYAGMIGQKLDPTLRSTSYVSGTGLAAIAAIDPDALYDVERAEVVRNARVIELAAKGEVVADATLDPLYPERWPARIEVETAAGTLVREVLSPIGAPDRPMGDADIEDKARKVLGHVGRADAVAPLASLTRTAFDTDASASRLARIFVEGRE
jgi:2-methylcitrate dehydratase PrpD